MMGPGKPFVVTIASEKGGVGKTTLATNLAVYLKALAEDLPVTIVSFDNHFSVDNMFAIGLRPKQTVADLFHGKDPAEIAQLGEYGVQYIASERQLFPSDNDSFYLQNLLSQSSIGGIFIIDTRPVIDYFTRCALCSADLLIIPVKDRPSLVNAAAISDVYREYGGSHDHVWLLPTLIDARLKLRNNIGIQKLLTFLGKEEGYQFLDFYIAKSPKVESLASGLSTRIFPILTHAKGTIVHRQLRKAADFVLSEYKRRPARVSFNSTLPIPAGRLRRFHNECLLCGESFASDPVLFWHDQRSRRRGALHSHCLNDIFDLAIRKSWLNQGIILLCCDLDRVGLSEEADTAIIRLYDQQAEEILSRPVKIIPGSRLEYLLVGITGRSLGEFFREGIFLSLEAYPLTDQLANPLYQKFHHMRRTIRRLQTLSKEFALQGFSC